MINVYSIRINRTKIHKNSDFPYILRCYFFKIFNVKIHKNSEIFDCSDDQEKIACELDLEEAYYDGELYNLYEAIA